jgi:hypothetical protein
MLVHLLGCSLPLRQFESAARQDKGFMRIPVVKKQKWTANDLCREEFSIQVAQ